MIYVPEPARLGCSRACATVWGGFEGVDVSVPESVGVCMGSLLIVR